MAIQRDDSVADEIHAAKMYILGKYNEQEIADLTGDDDVQAVEAKPDKNEAPKIMCVVCLEDIPEPNVVRCRTDEENEKNGTRDSNAAKHAVCRSCFLEMARNDMASPAKRVRCPGERCFTLFSSEQFRFLVDPATKFYDFDMFASLLRKEQVDDILGAISHNEACPFCYYIENFEGLPKQRHPLFQCKNDDCGKLSCRLCQSRAHDGKTCQEAKMSELDKNVEEQTRQVKRMLDEAMSEGRLRKCNHCKAGIELEAGCNKIRCRCSHYQCYYCGESLVTNAVEDDIRAAQNAKEKAEDALKGLLAEPGGRGAATAQLKQQLIQLKATHARKIQAADDKAYKHFDRSATTIYKKEKCPLYSNIDKLRCIKQFQCTKMTESRIRENCPGYNEDVLNSLVEKQLEEQNKRWVKLIRDANLDPATNPFPGNIKRARPTDHQWHQR
uniref:RING-type domain-containing protein n=1 Tax=Bionectria ochroleuca TaxID=29856 RepID=A0A8H7TR32_BIOOC